MALSDNEIIEQIRRGDKRRYSHLVEKYKDRAFGLALRLLKNREEAEEATEDAFIRAYNALERFQNRASFGTWLYRIVYNVCLTRLNSKKGGLKSLEYDEGKDYDEYPLTSQSSLYEKIEINDMVGFVHKIIGEMPERYQVILSLFYFQELSYQEICEIMELPLGTVKTHLFRARAMLQERLNRELKMENAS
jgi:RNA polymerase sigma-70 factor (ECF subfamily)